MDLKDVQKQAKVSVVDYLATVRRELGDDAWKAEIKKLALQAFRMGGTHEEFWRDLIKDFDWITADELKAQAQAMPAGGLDINHLMAQALKTQMPGLKTQAQFNTFRAAFEAFQAVCSAIFDGDASRETEARKILDTTLTACRQATDISRKLADVPEAATSKASEEFKKAPAEFQEYDIQQRLLGELGRIKDLDELKQWYEETKPLRDSVKSQTLRNILLDAVRGRKLALTPAEPPKGPS